MNIKDWWSSNRPIFMNKKKLTRILIRHREDITKIEHNLTWAAIRPIINDLEKLRANTWDQDKITFIQNYLKDNFKNE